jgi:hypothetical protein
MGTLWHPERINYGQRCERTVRRELKCERAEKRERLRRHLDLPRDSS